MTRHTKHSKRRKSMSALQKPVPDLRLVVYARSGNRCYYCGQSTPYARGTLDHRVPIARGGRTEVSNLCWSCRTCNEAKAGLSLAEYRVQCGSAAFWGEERDGNR